MEGMHRFDESLIEAISGYKSLSPAQRQKLRPLLHQIIEAHKEITRNSKTIRDFLAKGTLTLEFDRRK